MLSFLFRGSIRKKLIILFLLSALPGAVYILLSGLHERKKAIAESESGLLSFTMGIAEIQEQTTRTTRIMLDGLSRLPEVRHRNKKACYQIFLNILKINPVYAAVNLVDSNGNLVASATAKPPLNFSHTKHFRDAVAKKGFAAGEYLLSVTTGVPAFGFGQAIVNSKGVVTGALLTSIRLSRHVKLFESEKFPADSFVGFADHRGVRIYRFPKPEKFPGGDQIASNVFQAIKRGSDRGIFTLKNSDGTERVNAFQKMRLEPGDPPYMYIIAGIPKKVIYASARKGLWLNLIALLFTVGLAITFGWMLGGKKLSRKLKELGDAAGRIGKGDLKARVRIDSTITELMVLENAFNQMAQTLAQDIISKERANEERLALRERLQHAEKMEALGLLAGGVAHDLNNSLGILIGFAELLADSFEATDPRVEDVRRIIKGGWEATAIVQDLLLLARRGINTKNAISINGIVAEYLDSPEYSGIASIHPNVRVKTELDKNLLPVDGSHSNLLKALTNLIDFAAEAMPTGGEILIRTENSYVDKPVPGHDTFAEGEYVVLTVSDEGQGISDKDIKHIFEPFYTKKVMGMSGTGLGLPVVWGTVSDHSGYIDVQSELDKGTIFRLYFPVGGKGRKPQMPRS